LSAENKSLCYICKRISWASNNLVRQCCCFIKSIYSNVYFSI
jgi:hypothetical protein